MEPVANWNDVWAARRLDSARGTLLEQLLAADGFDTGFGSVTAEAWAAAVRHRARELGIAAGSSVFEVGCGAGAFLHELRALGCTVGGIDSSPALIEIARRALPDGQFDVCDAALLSPEPTADFVISSGVFLYFASLAYARGVVDAMVRKATGAVAILDVPDLSYSAAAIAERHAALGGGAAYRERYAGLNHLYYDRDWMGDALRTAGLTAVTIADQDITGYPNGRHRFNAWGFV
jgi:SAM-dependent methyltransferase